MHTVLTTTSSEQTESLACAIGKRMRGGEVVELVSDLGGGKTTFTRGLVQGIGSKDRVASPTFTISREYAGGRFRVYHFDFYRLQDAGVMADELREIITDPEAVTVVEWGEVVHHVLPTERLHIRITATNEHSRRLEITCPDDMAYLVEENK